jgi:hypothetical protein
MSHWYRVYGLALRSEISCPELTETDSQSYADVTISLKLSTASMAKDSASHIADIADVALFRIERGCEIQVQPAPGARQEDVRQFLYGVALTAILYQRGESPIHAGAVEVGGQAHMFCGASGAGKSTLMMQMRHRGVNVLCDDVGVIRQGADNIVRFYHGVPRVKLWRDALAHFDIDIWPLQRDLARHDKFHLPLANTAFDSLPLASIFNLVPGPTVDAPMIVAISSKDAFGIVMRNTYRPRLLKQLGDSASHAMRCVAAVRQAAGFEFRRPWDLDRLDAGAEALVSHLTALTTMETIT